MTDMRKRQQETVELCIQIESDLMKRFKKDLSSTLEEESQVLSDRLIQHFQDGLGKSATSIKEEMTKMRDDLTE